VRASVCVCVSVNVTSLIFCDSGTATRITTGLRVRFPTGLEIFPSSWCQDEFWARVAQRPERENSESPLSGAEGEESLGLYFARRPRFVLRCGANAVTCFGAEGFGITLSVWQHVSRYSRTAGQMFMKLATGEISRHLSTDNPYYFRKTVVGASPGDNTHVSGRISRLERKMI
jgi:hypothetical protein